MSAAATTGAGRRLIVMQGRPAQKRFRPRAIMFLVAELLCWNPMDEQDLAGTLLFSPAAAAATLSFGCARAKAPLKPSSAKMPDWRRWITSCQPSIPRRLPGSPRAAEDGARHPARLDPKGRNDCWKAGDLRQCVEELPDTDHRAADQGRPAEGRRRRWTTSAASTSPSPPALTTRAKRPAAMINLSGGTASRRCSPMRPPAPAAPATRANPHPLDQGERRQAGAPWSAHPRPPADPGNDPRPARAGQPLPYQAARGHQRSGRSPLFYPCPCPLANPAPGARLSGWRPFVDLCPAIPAISSFPLRSRVVNIANWQHTPRRSLP